jgi:hypothetical protein
MDLNIIQILVLRIAVPLLFLGISIAIVQYLLRYGINYYFKMKYLNERKKDEQINN